jgi:asparagine synthetase B (glutamine-hydrolysing)
VEEMNLDVSRISYRNMGRDDRIISSHGKEVRFPFLDEELVHFLSTIPVHFKADPRYSRQIGDKILLRSIAQQLGFHRASTEAKRAVQFGARTAKMELSNQKGHESLQKYS